MIDNTINKFYSLLFEYVVVKLLLSFCQGHLNFLCAFLNFSNAITSSANTFASVSKASKMISSSLSSLFLIVSLFLTASVSVDSSNNSRTKVDFTQVRLRNKYKDGKATDYCILMMIPWKI